MNKRTKRTVETVLVRPMGTNKEFDLEEAKSELLELAMAGAPRPRLDSKNERERELAIALTLLTERPYSRYV